MRYRKKPVEVEAFCLTEESERTAPEWFERAVLNETVWIDRNGCTIKTLEGKMHAKVGDYIIRGVNGELYPCKPDIFKKTYEKC